LPTSAFQATGGSRRFGSRHIDAEAGEVIDIGGDLVSPPFVDPHFHMDATLSYGLPRINAAARCWRGSRSGAN
jgi:cytosine/adenosine deaminase-related metal-dependent hydrolase